MKQQRSKNECSMRGSNSRPPDYETDALPTELTEQAFDVNYNPEIKIFNAN